MKAFFIVAWSITVRLLRLKRLIGMLILTCAPALLLLAMTGAANPEEALEIHDNLILIMVIPLIFPLTGIVISSAALGEERRAGTLPDLLLKPAPRAALAGAAAAAALLASMVIIGGGAAAHWLALSIRTGDWTIGLGLLPAAAVQAVGWAALFVPLGLLLSRAVLIGMAYLILWELTLGAFLDGIRSTSLFRIAVSAWADWGTLSPANQEALELILGRVKVGGWGAAAKVAVLLVLSVIATWLILQRRELMSGSGEE